MTFASENGHGIWNVRFTETAAREVAKYKLDWVGVQVRGDKDGTEPATYFCGKGSENQFSTCVTSGFCCGMVEVFALLGCSA